MEKIENLKQKTLISLFWKYSERMGAQLISFIVSVILARILSPDNYGTIAIVSIFTYLAGILATGGIGNAIIQSKYVHKIDYDTMFTTSFILSVFIYFLLFFIAPVIARFYNNYELVSIIRILGIGLIISSINTIQHAYVSRNMIFKKFFFSTLIGTIIGAVVGIVMAINNFGVWSLVAQSLSKSITDSIVLLFTIDLKIKVGFSKTSFRRLFPYGFKLMLTNFIGGLFNQIKNFIIGTRYSSTDLAYSTKGEQIPSVITNNINNAIESVLFSSISKLNDNLDIMKEVVKKTIKISTFIMMPMMFGIIACADKIVDVLYTQKWEPIIPFLQVLCFQYSIAILGSMNLQVINARGRSDIALKLEFIKKPIFVIFILAGVAFGPFYIVLANALYSIVGIILNTMPNKKLINYGVLEQIKDVLPNILCSIVMMLLVILIGKIHFNVYLILLLQSICGAVAYFIMQSVIHNESLECLKSIVKTMITKYKLKKRKI